MTSNQSTIQRLSSSPSLGQLSINAAGFFLGANCDYQAFLKKIEITPLKEYTSQGRVRLDITSNGGVIYRKLKNRIDKSIEDMEMAHSIYYRVWKMTESLERNPVVLEKLAQFDYRLMSDEKQLIPSIFNDVENFLKPGNLPGAFEKIFNDTGEILQGMKYIKSLLEANTIDIAKCWEVNQRLLKSELFGQYISLVFTEIRKSIM
jgi:hypothetical protein